MSSSKEILLFRRVLLNPVTCLQFQHFLCLKGGFLENDVLFWQEVQRYKVRGAGAAGEAGAGSEMCRCTPSTSSHRNYGGQLLPFYTGLSGGLKFGSVSVTGSILRLRYRAFFCVLCHLKLNNGNCCLPLQSPPYKKNKKTFQDPPQN